MAKVTAAKLEIFVVKVNRRGDWVLPRITANTGVTGIGDASHGGDETIPLMKSLFEFLRGRSIHDMEPLRQHAQKHIARAPRPAAVALSGLEQCLWDIRGKLLDVPVYDLLGGALRTAIRNYANINRSTEVREPAGFAAMALRARQAGFDAFKLAPFDDMPPMSEPPQVIEKFTQLGIARAQAVRDVIGPERDLLLDVHSHLDLPRGLELARRLEPLNLFWLEEVTPARPSLDSLAAINQAAAMPTAGGESIYGVKGFYDYIAAGAADIAMPDVKYCGGVLELKKIAALAEAAGVPVAPHGPASPIGNLAAAHVCATIPNFHILEFSFGEVPWRAELVDPPEVVSSGRMNLTAQPGWGVTLNEKTAARYRA